MPIVEIRMPEDEKEGTEASLGSWLKQPGDTVSENEPLVEVATDKVTIEIAAPASGVLLAFAKASGDQVLPGERLGSIETAAGSAAAESSLAPSAIEKPASAKPLPEQADAATADTSGTLSPVVRRLLEELGLTAQEVPKTGRGTRLTPADIAAYLSAGQQRQAPPASKDKAEDSAFASGTTTGRLVLHTPMRKSIASHMARSVQTAPHVTAVFEADMFNVFADREARKAQNGEAPSVTAYLIQAAIRCIKLVPEVNSKWHDAHLEVFDHVNFGVGTALDTGGLVVPVIRDAHQMDLLTLSGALRSMTAKAREGKLTQADLEGGTFTLSNHGVSGSLMAAPIILPHGQAAILGAGKVQKRTIVCETGGRELFRIRPMMYVTLTVDHRVLDGQHANGFMSAFVKALETPA